MSERDMSDEGDAIADIIEEGIRLWPSSIKATRIYTDKNRYYLQVLFEINEDISRKLMGNPSAVVQFNLHDAIYETVHNRAEHGRLYLMSDLPLDDVRANFVERLRCAVSDPELGWNDEEIAIARGLLERDARSGGS